MSIHISQRSSSFRYHKSQMSTKSDSASMIRSFTLTKSSNTSFMMSKKVRFENSLPSSQSDSCNSNISSNYRAKKYRFNKDSSVGANGITSKAPEREYGDENSAFVTRDPKVNQKKFLTETITQPHVSEINNENTTFSDIRLEKPSSILDEFLQTVDRLSCRLETRMAEINNKLAQTQHHIEQIGKNFVPITKDPFFSSPPSPTTLVKLPPTNLPKQASTQKTAWNKKVVGHKPLRPSSLSRISNMSNMSNMPGIKETPGYECGSPNEIGYLLLPKSTALKMQPVPNKN